jgi:hypothetical protein
VRLKAWRWEIRGLGTVAWRLFSPAFSLKLGKIFSLLPRSQSKSEQLQGKTEMGDESIETSDLPKHCLINAVARQVSSAPGTSTRRKIAISSRMNVAALLLFLAVLCAALLLSEEITAPACDCAASIRTLFVAR